MTKQPRFRQILLYLVLPALLFSTGWHGHDWYHHRHGHNPHRRVRLTGFRFISPLVDDELPEGYGVRQEPIPFKRKIEEFVQRQIDSGQVRNLSVYFRDLSDGPWFGINQGVEYNPASMMKVPVMIAWLKRVEKEPQVLKRTFVFDGKQDLSAMQTIRPAQTITPGRGYTVEQLLHYMMDYSDNNATSLLYEGVSTAELNDVLLSMDIDNKPQGDGNSVTVHGFSGFFRILYNAAYLNREMSEKALQLLSLQDFPGIAAGVPKGTVVAAKFGEHCQGSPGEDMQLHEFGIVYHPKGPYIVGIMSRGHDLAIQKDIIREISARIYAEVDRSFPAKDGAPVPGNK
jgi:beta-lactamase class A